LSDIANAAGDMIIKEVLIKKEIKNYKKRSNYRWPNQEQPHLPTFTIWKSILSEVFGVNSSGNLQQKLGEWKIPPVEKIQFQYIVDPLKTKLLSQIFHDDDHWTEHSYQKYARGKIYYIKTGRIVPTPDDINKYIPVDATIGNNSITINSRTCRLCLQNIGDESNNNKTVRSFNQYLIDEQKDAPGTVKIIDSNDQILQTPNIREITICTDGGLRQKKGGFGVILSINKTTAVRGAKRVKETFNDMTSYRAEALWILAGLYLYKRLNQHWSLKHITQDHREITILCDNESVIKTINKFKHYKLNQKIMYSADADVFMEIKKCITEID
jgi:ribonuclease HI